jgi:diguanylate cyclase (GGDEF)-like protein/PAS domain S-box-containing protein
MKKISLRFKMMLGGMLVVAIPLVVAGIANYFYVSRSLETMTRERAALISESLAHQLQASLKGELKTISALAVDPQIIEAVSSGKYSKSLHKKMEETFQVFGVFFSGIYIADKAGIIRLDAADIKRQGLDLSGRDYFQKARAGTANISDPIFSKATGEPIVMLCAPIIANKHFVGVVGGALEIDYLLAYISSFKHGASGYAFMLNRHGIVIAHPRKEAILKMDLLKTAGTETIARRMIAQQTGTEEYVFEGVRKMAGFAPIESTGWSVAVTQNRDEFLAPARTIILHIMIFIPIALFITLIIAAIFIRKISRPILDLNEAAKGLAIGKWQRVPDTGLKDELGEVVRSFNSMSDQLQKLFISLEQSETKYRRIVDTAREGIWVVGPDQLTTFVNAGMVEMLGYPEADIIIGRPVSDFMFAEDVPEYNHRTYNRQLGISETSESRLRTRNGDVLWVLVSYTTVFDDDGHFTGAFAMFTDITARKRAEDELVRLNQDLEQRVSLRTAELASKAAELENSLAAREKAEANLQRLYVAIESGSTAVIIANSEHHIIYANPAVQILSGYSEQEILGAPIWRALGAQEQEKFFEHAMESIHSGHTWRGDVYCRRKDGGGYWVDASLSGVPDKQGVIISFVAVVDDITEKRDLQQRLMELSYLDGLTGLFNRRQFDKQLDEEWRRCARRKLPLSLIMIDIDYFKLYNDTYGHLEGDECLKKVAKCIENALLRRAGDLVARYGGEEFVALLPDTDVDGACAVAETMRAVVESLNLLHQASPLLNHVTISLGVACIVPVHAGDPSLLVAAADRMLYHSKSTGRNRVSVEPTAAGAGPG